MQYGCIGYEKMKRKTEELIFSLSGFVAFLIIIVLGFLMGVKAVINTRQLSNFNLAAPLPMWFSLSILLVLFILFIVLIIRGKE